MHLQSAITVRQPLDEVTGFFFEPSSLAKWDKSVAEMVPVSAGDGASGARFDTVAPSGLKMQYEVIELQWNRHVKVRLVQSRMFRKAVWQFDFVPVQGGTRVTCHIDFILRPLYFFLYPVLYFNKRALFRDLDFFREALDIHTRSI